MLTIRSEQMQVLRDSVRAAWRDQGVRAILQQLKEARPELMAPYPENEAQRMVQETLEAAAALGIADPATLLNWCYIRALTRTPFFRADAFRDILGHPFLHPEAKGRHLVMAFFAIQRLQQPPDTPWPR